MSYPDYLLDYSNDGPNEIDRLRADVATKAEQLLEANIEIIRLKKALEIEKTGNAGYYKNLQIPDKKVLNSLYDEIYKIKQQNEILIAKIKVAIEDLQERVAEIEDLQ